MQTQTQKRQRNPKSKKFPFYRLQGSKLTPRTSFRLPKKGILSRYPLRKQEQEEHPASLQARKRIFTNELGALTQSVLKEKKDKKTKPWDAAAKQESPALDVLPLSKTHTQKTSKKTRSSFPKADFLERQSHKSDIETEGVAAVPQETKTASQAQDSTQELPNPTLPKEKIQIQIKDGLGLEENLKSELLSEFEEHTSKARDIPDLIIEDFDYKAAGLEETIETPSEQKQKQEIDAAKQKTKGKKAPQTSQSTKETDLPESPGRPQELSIGITEFQEDYLIDEGPAFLPENKKPKEKKKTPRNIQLETTRQKDIAKQAQKPKEPPPIHHQSPSAQQKAKSNPQVDWLNYEWHPEKNSLYYKIANIYKKNAHEEKDFGFLIEHIRKEAGASAAAIVLFNEEKTVYQRILDSGLDEITARNLYFGIQDAYVNPQMQGKKIPLLHGDSRDFYFQKRFSSDFFHSTDYFTVHNLIPLGFDGYLLLFYRKKDEKKTIFAELQGLLRDTLPVVYSFAKQAWYEPVKTGEIHGLLQRLIFESLRKASKGGKEAIWVYHINLISLLKSQGGYEKVQQIYREMEKDIQKHPSVFFLQLLPHRFVLFGESKEELDIYKDKLLRLCGEQGHKTEIRQSFYPSDGENLFNYIAPN